MPTINGAPAFQFYASDWLADANVKLLTLEETGAYIEAIAVCWREGSIPADPVLLSRIIGKGCSTDVATNVQRLFNIRCADECSGVERLKHKRLESEREKQRKRSEQQAAAGKRSAEIKREAKEKSGKPKRSNKRSTSVQHPNNSSSSPSGEDEVVAFESLVSGFPDCLRTREFLHAWTNWAAHRREIKKPLTDTQCAHQLKEFETWGSARAIAAINFTITKGWQGLKEPDLPPGQKPSPDLFGGQREYMERRQRNAEPDFN